MPENPVVAARLMQGIVVPRMTFNMNVYHSLPGEEAQQWAVNGDCLLTVPENSYTRTVTVDSNYQVLDFGFIKNNMMGTIILFNITGTQRNVNPTDEEKEQDASAVIAIAPYEGLFVPPRLVPTILNVGAGGKFNGLSVRSLGSPARLRYFGVPK